jgi:drug/metabolite transporter (DMT)-like permease
MKSDSLNTNTNTIITVTNLSRGMFIGFLGIAMFSFTLPVTRYAIQFADPLVVAWSRAVVAGLIAAALLYLSKQRKPNRSEARLLCGAIMGIVFGWPTLSSLSMKYAPAAHGAVINGLLPISTAMMGAWLAKERLNGMFWLAACIGSALVAIYALWEGAGHLQAGDGVMLAAVVMGGLGYAAGGTAARTLGGWQTICWALVLALPLTILASLWAINAYPVNFNIIPLSAWLAFAYLALVSQLIGFFAWYAGLAMGGVGRVGQVQLLQVFMTVCAAASIGLDPVPARTWIFAVLVMVVLVWVRWLGKHSKN